MMSLHDAALGGKLESLRSLVAGGRNVNKCDGIGRTPLHVAVKANRVECVNLLLDTSNIHPNVQDQQMGWTPLHTACAHGNLRCVLALLSRSAIDPMILDKAGKTAFDLLVREETLESGGTLYTWGNGSTCALGHGSMDNKVGPKSVRALEGKQVSDVSVSPYSMACVTRSGECFTAGLGAGGRLGHGDEEPQMIPKRVLGVLHTKRVIKVVTAHSHTAAITDAGHLFTWGDGEYGKLGHGDRESCLHPKRVRGPLESKMLITAALGRHHSLAVTQTGELFSFGRGDSGQLGYLMAQMNKDMLSQTTPRMVVGINSPVSRVAAGTVHSVCVTERNDAFLFGLGSYSLRRISLPSSAAGPSFLLPSSSLESPPSSLQKSIHAITDIAASGNMTLLIQDQKEISLLLAQNETSGGKLPSSLPQQQTILLPESIPRLPGARKRITSAQITCNQDIFVTTESGQLWKFSVNNAHAWKRLSFQRFSRIACGPSHFAGIIDDSFSFRISPTNHTPFAVTLVEMLDHPEFCDVEFVFNGQSMNAHCAILAARCKYLANLLRARRNDADKDHEKIRIAIDRSEYRVLPFFLSYLYTDSFRTKSGQTPSPAEIKDLLSVARKYELPCHPGTFFFRRLHQVLVESEPVHDSKGASDKLGRSTYGEDIKKLLEDTSFTDAVLISAEGVRIPCHKFLLAAKSDVFKAMLSGIMYEARTGDIMMPEVKAFTLYRLKEWIYGYDLETVGLGSSGNESKLSPSVLADLCGLGNELMCEELKEACERLLIKHLNEQNVVSIWMTADAYRATRLKEACLCYLKRFLPHLVISGVLSSSLATSQPLLLEELEKELQEERKDELLDEPVQRKRGKSNSRRPQESAQQIIQASEPAEHLPAPSSATEQLLIDEVQARAVDRIHADDDGEARTTSPPITIPAAATPSQRRRRRGRSHKGGQTMVPEQTAWGGKGPFRAKSLSPTHSFLDIQKEQQQQEKALLQNDTKRTMPKNQPSIREPHLAEQLGPSVQLGSFIIKEASSQLGRPHQKKSVRTRDSRGDAREGENKPTHTSLRDVTQHRNAESMTYKASFAWKNSEPRPQVVSLAAIQHDEHARRSVAPPVKDTNREGGSPQSPPQTAVRRSSAGGRPQPDPPGSISETPSHNPSSKLPPPLFPQAPRVSLHSILAAEERRLEEDRKKKEKPSVQPLWLIQLEEEAMAELRAFYGKEEISKEEIEAAYKYK